MWHVFTFHACRLKNRCLLVIWNIEKSLKRWSKGFLMRRYLGPYSLNETSLDYLYNLLKHALLFRKFTLVHILVICKMRML